MITLDSPSTQAPLQKFAQASFPTGLRESILGKSFQLLRSGMRIAWHLTKEFMQASLDERGEMRKIAEAFLGDTEGNAAPALRPAYVSTRKATFEGPRRSM